MTIFLNRWLYRLINSSNFFRNFGMAKGMFILCFWIFPFFSFSQRSWDGGGDAVNWSDVSNWDNNAVPLSTENVTIGAGYTVTIDGAASCNDLSLGSGTQVQISAANSLTINGNLDITDAGGGADAILNAAAGTLSVTGTVTLGTVGQNSIQVSTGTITFASAVSLANDVNQDITLTGAGTANFNGGLTVNGAGVFTTVAGCTVNFGGSYTIIGSGINVTWNASSNAVFNSGSSTITSNASSAFGNFQINSGVTVTLADDIQIEGDWTNSGGTFIPGINKVTFNGSTAQSITGETFFDLTINNTAGGISLGSDITITNVLTLTNGVVTTGANILILSNTAAANLSYTNGFVYGNLRRHIASNANTYFFPVGNGTASTDRHQVAFINNTITGVSYIDASVTDFTQASPNNDAALSSTQGGTPITNTAGEAAGKTTIWTLIPNASPTGGSYGVQLFVENTNLSATDDDLFCPLKRNITTSYSNFLTYDGTTAIPASGPGRIYGGGTGYAERTGYTSFSEYIIGKGVWPLPVEFLSFNAKSSRNLSGENIVDVVWSTASEFNSDYFVVQRSKDGIVFQDITKVTAAGNSTTIKSYSAPDHEPYSGISYYRLKQVDHDSKFKFSNMVEVKCNLKEDAIPILVFPNPANSVFSVSIKTNIGEEISITVKDMQGKELYSEVITASNDEEIISINPSGKFTAGVYSVIISSNNRIYEKKLILQ